MELGEEIKKLRLKSELTQEELSKLSKVPFATINKIEKNSANPTLKTIEKILKVFGRKLNITGIEIND